MDTPNKKRVSSVSPLQAIKTKIFNPFKNAHSSKKINNQLGNDYYITESKKVDLNPIRINIKKPSIEK